MKVPEELQYTEEHIWVQLAEKQAKVGLTEFAQKELGDIVFIELPQVGDVLQRGDSFGSIESVKTVTELIAPISGKVVEVNKALLEKPDHINGDPYILGWMISIECSDQSQLGELWSAERYLQTYADEV